MQKAFLDDLVQRNRQLVKPASVEVGQEGLLKRREKEEKEMQRYHEIKQMRDERRALRDKR